MNIIRGQGNEKEISCYIKHKCPDKPQSLSQQSNMMLPWVYVGWRPPSSAGYPTACSHHAPFLGVGRRNRCGSPGPGDGTVCWWAPVGSGTPAPAAGRPATNTHKLKLWIGHTYLQLFHTQFYIFLSLRKQTINKYYIWPIKSVNLLSVLQIYAESNELSNQAQTVQWPRPDSQLTGLCTCTVTDCSSWAHQCRRVWATWHSSFLPPCFHYPTVTVCV